ncbi:MAG: protein kinase [Phycisphaera sp.]|nr:protein kinase [Phycisphaera sp.]
MDPADVISELTRLGIVDDRAAAELTAECPPDVSVLELTKAMTSKGVLTEHQAKIVSSGNPAGLVIGDYVILEKLGQGGMGAVYRARHRVMHREVALKVLPPSAGDDDQTVQRFLREVRAAGALSHPNIVTAHDAGHNDDALYLVMECVEGKDVGAILTEREAPLPVDDAIYYAIQAATGLAYAHSRGVIHRDIKPGNLLLDNDGVIKILDMGLARIEHEIAGGDFQTLTQTDASMGTAAYMPPEQGMDAKSVDQRGDIYSLGCTLYRLLTNQYPYYRDTPLGTMMAHVQEPIPRLPDGMPAGLQDVLDRMMAKQPDDRYASCAEVIAALEAVLNRGKPSVPDVRDIPVAKRASQAAAPPVKPGVMRWVAIAAAVAIVAVPTYILLNADHAPKNIDPSASVNSGVPVTEPPAIPDRPDAAASPTPIEVLTSDEYVWTEPVNVAALNTPDQDGWGDVCDDQRTFVFGSHRPGGLGSNDLWESRRASINEPWGEPVNLGPTVNTRFPDLGPSVTADGLVMVFESSRPGGAGSVDLWVSTRVSPDEPWGEPEAMSINSDKNDLQPSISGDGLALVLCSDREGSATRDLWMSTRASRDAPWSTPTNLGDPVNTAYAEISPELSSDGLVLLFSSHREKAGRMAPDLWMSSRPALTAPWSEPVRIDALSSDQWDTEPSLSRDGATLYFHSDRDGGKGKSDIWMSRRVRRDAGTK